MLKAKFLDKAYILICLGCQIGILTVTFRAGDLRRASMLIPVALFFGLLITLIWRNQSLDIELKSRQISNAVTLCTLLFLFWK